MPAANISLLFPTPILNTTIGREFTAAELDFCQAESQDLVQNVGNMHSYDTYILNHPKMADLKAICEEVVNTYIQNVLKPRDEVQAYITQSWLNYTKRGQHMHKHSHTNSFLSGVLYIHAERDIDKITFHDREYRQICFPSSEYDGMNSESWWFPVGTGDIIVFPSETVHSVEPVEADEVRISLAFNTFLNGTLGCKDRLTELKIQNELS